MELYEANGFETPGLSWHTGSRELSNVNLVNAILRSSGKGKLYPVGAVAIAQGERDLYYQQNGDVRGSGTARLSNTSLKMIGTFPDGLEVIHSNNGADSSYNTDIRFRITQYNDAGVEQSMDTWNVSENLDDKTIYKGAVLQKTSSVGKSDGVWDNQYCKIGIDNRNASNAKLFVKFGTSTNPADILYFTQSLAHPTASIDNLQFFGGINGGRVDDFTVYKYTQDEVTGALDAPEGSWDFSKQLYEIPLTCKAGKDTNIKKYAENDPTDWTNQAGLSSSADIYSSLSDGRDETFVYIQTASVGFEMTGSSAYDIGTSSYDGITSPVALVPQNVEAVQLHVYRINDDNAEPINFYLSSSQFDGDIYSASVSSSVDNYGCQNLFIDMSGLTNSDQSPVTASDFNSLKGYFNRNA